MALDLTDQAIICQALIAATREMGVKLIRSAFSTIVREANDASAALLDRDGNHEDIADCPRIETLMELPPLLADY